MTLVSVGNGQRIVGWNGPGTRGAWEAFKVMDLREALEATFDFDAHMLMYVAEGKEWHHRVNRKAYDLYPSRLLVTVFSADWDTVGHQPWPEGDEHQARELIERWRRDPHLQGAAFHDTYKGIHIIQPLLHPIPINQALPYYRWWLAGLKAAGVEYDTACEKEVGRLWRLPNVRRRDKGRPDEFDFRAKIMALEDVRPLALPELSGRELGVYGEARESPRGVRRLRATLAQRQDPDVGEPWCYRTKVIAEACRKEPENWHEMFLYLAGALLDKGAPPNRLRAICSAISVETGADDKLEDRMRSVQTTLERLRRGDSVGGYHQLLKQWRQVALALDESLSIQTQEDFKRWQDHASAPALPSGKEASQALRDALSTAGDGVTMIEARTGTGKSAASTDEAASRAAGVVRGPTNRAPLGSKSAFSVDKHELAKQYQKAFAELGIAVKRLFNPLTVLRDDGEPECIHHRTATHLVAGRLSMQWELCRGRDTEPCERFETCRARLGYEGPEDALITIGTHANANTLAGEAGSTGTLYVDEPPATFEKITITLQELQSATAALPDFGTHFGSAMRPAMQALTAWYHSESPTSSQDPVDVVRAYASQVNAADLGFAKAQTELDTDDPVELARAAIDPKDSRGRSQLSIRPVARHLSVHNLQHAARIGAAARVLGAVHRALASDLPGAGLWQERQHDGEVIVLYLPNESYIRALKRQGRSIILDANAASSRPLLARFLGYEPTLHTFDAADGAKIQRTWRVVSNATRSGWFDGACPKFEEPLVHAIHAALHWADQVGLDKSLGIITMHAIELALRLAHSPEDTEAQRKWHALGLPEDLAAHVRREFGPSLQARSGPILWGHYGAIRGLNRMANVDMLVTLGDPWFNVMCTEHEVAFALLDKTGRARGEELCQNELNQAHGRIRPVHRTRAGWALHVGAVRPGGRSWMHEVEVRTDRGRPANARKLSPEQVQIAIARLGGPRSASKYLRCSDRTLRRYASGERAPDGSLLEELMPLVDWSTAWVPSSRRTENPIKKNSESSLLRIFGPSP